MIKVHCDRFGCSETRHADHRMIEHWRDRQFCSELCLAQHILKTISYDANTVTRLKEIAVTVAEQQQRAEETTEVRGAALDEPGQHVMEWSPKVVNKPG